MQFPKFTGVAVLLFASMGILNNDGNGGGAAMTDIQALRKLGEIVNFNQDEILFQQGEKGDYAFLILRGKVAVILNSVFDGGEVIIAEIGEGDMVGEMAILEESVRAATVKAMDAVIALKIKEAQFQEFLKLNPKYARGMLSSLCHRILATSNKIAERVGGTDGC